MKSVAIGITVNSIDEKNRIILSKEMLEGLNYTDEDNANFVVIEHDNYLSVHNFNDILQKPITELKKYEFFIENANISKDRRLLLKKRFVDSLELTSPVIIFGRINQIDIVPNHELNSYLSANIENEHKKEAILNDINRSLEKRKVKTK